MTDDDSDEKTPPRARMPPTDSERQRHFRRFPPSTPVVDEPVAAGRDRDLESERARRAMSDSERGRRVHGVPMMRAPDDEPDTSPVDMLDREPDEQVREVVRRSRRESGAPATVEDIVALKLSWERAKARDKSSSAEAQKVLAMLPSPDELRQMRADVGVFKKVAIAIILAVLGTLGTVAKGLYDRGGHDTAVDLRIERLERDAERERDRREPPTPPFPTQKGQTP